MKCTKGFLSIFSFFLLLITIQTTSLHASNFLEFDFSAFDENNDDNAAEIMPSTAHHVTRFPKDVTLQTLTNLDIQNVLKTELYQKTHKPLSRNPLDIPILQNMTIYNDEFKITPFYSSMWEQNYTNTSPHIKSYINLELHDIMDVLAENEFTTIQIPEVLELFHPLKMQEHTLGLMFQNVKLVDQWAYTFSAPLLYTLNNFYLTKDEQERIDNYPLFEEFNGDVMVFARKHLISDRLGIGDTLLTAEYCFVDTYRAFQSIGVRLTIPTAFAFKKGLYGAHFNASAKPYTLDLYSDLIDPYLEDIAHGSNANTATIQQNVENFSLSALNRLSTLLLERNMGSDYHWGLGACYRSTINITDSISMISRMNFDIKMPSVLKRFFLVDATPADFAQFDWTDNNAQVDEKIDFLNTQFAHMFFPTMYQATVFPGVLFHSTSCLKRHMASGRWAPSIGFDSYFHTPEHFISINAPAYNLARINKEKARRGKAWSSSVWICIEKEPVPTSDWTFAWKGYVSMLNAGFGDAFGLALTFEKNF